MALPTSRAPAYDPTVHASPAWTTVTCTRCGRSYECTPYEDFITPAEALNWPYGDVCEPCVLGLAHAKGLID